MNWNLVTFAGGSPRWYWASFRLSRQAKSTGKFSKVFRMSLFNVGFNRYLKSEFGISPLEKRARGFGYWRWKPALIQYVLQKLPENEAILYLDAGFEINTTCNSMVKLDDYFRIAESNGFLIMKQEHTLLEWTKREALERFGISSIEARKIPMVVAGALFFSNKTQSKNLLRDWLKLAKYEPNLFDDIKSWQYKSFKDHRHDQSVLSILVYNREANVLGDETYVFMSNPHLAHNFPLWAVRNSGPRSKIQKPICSREE